MCRARKGCLGISVHDFLLYSSRTGQLAWRLFSLATLVSDAKPANDCGSADCESDQRLEYDIVWIVRLI